MKYLNDRLKLYNNKGWGTIETLILIFVLGVLLVLVAHFVTSTALVVNEINDQEVIEQIALSYLGKVAKEARQVDFFDSMSDGEFPPVPLTSEYTKAGTFSILVETETFEDDSKKVIMTFRKPSSISYEDPMMTISSIIEPPENYQNPNFY